MTERVHATRGSVLPAPEFKRWNQRIGDLLNNLFCPHLPNRMRKAAEELVPFEHMMIFGYRKRGRPLDLYNPGDTDYRKVIVQHYVAGSYLLDPFYHTYLAGFEDRIYSLVEVKPAGFDHSEYNITHYDWTGIYDEVVFFVELDNELTSAVSFTRGQSWDKFNQSEIEKLNSAIPVLSGTIRHHWNGADHPETPPGDLRSLVSLNDHIQHAFKVFGKSILTKRETEIMSLIIRGLSTNAMSDRLGISAGTVKIHRKNAYRKLNISSQNELFSIFLTSLTDPDLSTSDREREEERSSRS
jgi:DNA-binding CsgD family transcriptional regulator